LEHLTFSQLQAQKGVLYEDQISEQADAADVLLFHTLDELSSVIDVYIGVADMVEIASKAVLMLKLGSDYLKDQGALPPYGVAYLLNKLERKIAGLDPEA
jgi:hypothetical protein